MRSYATLRTKHPEKSNSTKDWGRVFEMETKLLQPSPRFKIPLLLVHLITADNIHRGRLYGEQILSRMTPHLQLVSWYGLTTYPRQPLLLEI